MKFVLILVSLLFPFVSMAFDGDTKSNGGDVVACTNNRGNINYELFDLYEGRRLYGYEPRYSVAWDKPIELVQEVIQNLRKYDPIRADLYQRFADSLYAEVRYVFYPLYDIRDEGVRWVPQNCNLEQVVWQLRTPDADGKKYYFNRTIFNKLDPQTQAALYIHEFVYREGLQADPFKFQTSVSVRYFTAFLFSAKFMDSTLEEYQKKVEAVGLKVNPVNPQ
ncbi:hypothetical protein [Bdellovibrio sp. HCB337]|uniref:hypothetical protein n=1 Tax=Bdellovibrio sp. HCB337 TaxID=3394358 RepID=UPI0039A45F56